MDRKLSDEQIDKIAKNLLQNYASDDARLDEIAESPRLWWNVKSRIEAEKARREKSRFVIFRPQILAFGALAIVVCFGLAILFFNFAKNSNPAAARQNPVQKTTEEIARTPSDFENVAPQTDSQNSATAPKSNPVPAKIPVRNVESKSSFAAKNQRGETSTKLINKPSKKEISPSIAVEETKTDFIALSYAANTESGQIVRMKVPISMMVSLGIKTNVEKESELVSAEVVIGDDGLARAIRFIR